MALQVVGSTPLIPLKRIDPAISVKLEFLNPTGSIKDRPAKQMIESAERTGSLKLGMKVVAATSGNFGTSLSFVCALKGYEFIAVVPDSVSETRVKLIESYGGKVVYALGGLEECVKKADQFKKCLVLNQFDDSNNIRSHEETTGIEILKQTINSLDAFIAGVGSGGTLIGVAKTLRKKIKDIKIYAVKPTQNDSGIEGINETFVPQIVKDNIDLISDWLYVSRSDAIKMSKRLIREEGLFAGISSGANVHAALTLSNKFQFKKIVTVLPDSADRYLDTSLFRK